MAKAFKLFDPNTGLTSYRDCVTGELLTAEQIALIVPCPTREVVATDACVQPIGNTDPLLVESSAKQVCTYEIAYNADDTVAGTALVGTLLTNAAGEDVTATHEITDCPAGLVPVGEVCY